MTKKGNRHLKCVYLTDAEDEYVRQKQQEYGYNFSRMCRYALLHLDDTSAKKKIQVTTEHNILIEERQRQLAAIGNNINQIAHQVNIFAIDGKIPEQYVTDVIIPAIDELQSLYQAINIDQLLIKKRLYTR